MKAYPNLQQGWAILLWYIVFAFLAVALLLPFMNLETFEMSSSSLMLMNLLVMLFVSLFGIRKSGNRVVPVIGELSNNSILLFPVLIFVVLCNIVLLDPLINLIPGAEWFSEMMTQSLQRDWPTFVSIVLVAPIFEEFILRGIVLEGFLKNYGPKKAIIQSSLIFGVLHFNPWQFVGAFLMGLLLGWVYYRTRSLIPCIFIHLVNNLISFLGFIYLEEEIASLGDFLPTWQLVIAIALGAVGLYFGIKALDKLMAPAQQLIETQSEANEQETETE